MCEGGYCVGIYLFVGFGFLVGCSGIIWVGGLGF